jgi:thiol-disulfide isomerase/thioredoxin
MSAWPIFVRVRGFFCILGATPGIVRGMISLLTFAHRGLLRCAPLAALAIAPSAIAAPVPIADLRSAIWSACADLPPSAPAAACDDRRQATIAQLWAIGQAPGDDARRIEALGLVAAWAPAAMAQSALDRLTTRHGNDPRTAPALEAAYLETRAPARRATLTALAKTTHAHAVAGSALFLLAAETLAQRDAAPVARAQALARLRLIQRVYADVPTQLLGAGDPPRLGYAAAALRFRQTRLVPGAMLPAMAARDLNRHRVTSADFRGKATLIDFWATWCPPCVAAMPELRATAARYRGAGLQIVSISGDAGAAAPKAFVARAGNTWPQWLAGPSGTVSPAWSNDTFPFYILVDRQGRIVAADQTLTPVLGAIPRALR